MSRVETVVHDAGYAFRLLRRAPGFTAVSVLMLSLGIGANAAIFSIVQAVLLRPLPYPAADRIVALSSTVRGEPGAPTSPPDFADWRQLSHSFSDVAAVFAGRPVNLMGVADPERLIAARVSAEFFPVFAEAPLIGRVFSPEEDRPGAAPVVVLGYDFWQRRFGGDRRIVGTSIVLDGRAHEVLGVMPPRFRYPAGQDMWLPLAVAAMQPWGRRAHVLDIVGRLRNGVSIHAADAEMRAVAGRLEREHPDTNAGWSVLVLPLRDQVVGQSRLPVLILFGAVGLVLLIACANVANLSLARGAARRREIAIRAALGASGGRLVRQLLTESIALAGLASVAGIGMAAAVLRASNAVMLEALPRADEVSLDWTAIAFTAGVSLATGVLFGLAPSAQASTMRVVEGLKGAEAAGSAGAARGFLRSGLAAAQMALSVVLLVSAGLLLASFQRLQRIDTGFASARVLTMRVSVPGRPGEAPAEAARRIVTYYDTALDRIRVVPGVQAAGATATLPLAGGDPFLPFTIVGEPPLPIGAEHRADQERATSDYFRVMGIGLVRGRLFDTHDTFAAPPVLIVNDAFARRFFPGRDPIGQRIVGEGGLTREVVGIVGDIRHVSLDRAPTPQMYLAQPQWPSSGMTIVVRTAGDPSGAAAAIRAAVQSVDRSLPVYAVKTMDEVLGGTLSPRRFVAVLLSAFALVALVLAVIGVYGLMAWLVNERIREIGIRMALGASRAHVVAQIVGRGLLLSSIGLLAGVVAAAGATRLMRTLLFDIRPTEPAVFLAVGCTLLGAAAIACYVPARRGSRIDPLIALRSE